ncbi:hypothetical protein BDD12DRAFT_324087 [Trichophaea hybrida]|nr:hypothetical protein BDD12DRAFT_324087 [Trichophaea hybrida]
MPVRLIMFHPSSTESPGDAIQDCRNNRQNGEYSLVFRSITNARISALLSSVKDSSITFSACSTAFFTSFIPLSIATLSATSIALDASSFFFSASSIPFSTFFFRTPRIRISFFSFFLFPLRQRYLLLRQLGVSFCSLNMGGRIFNHENLPLVEPFSLVCLTAFFASFIHPSFTTPSATSWIDCSGTSESLSFPVQMGTLRIYRRKSPCQPDLGQT